MDWIQLAQNSVQWRDFVERVMKVRVSQKCKTSGLGEQLQTFQEIPPTMQSAIPLPRHCLQSWRASSVHFIPSQPISLYVINNSSSNYFNTATLVGLSCHQAASPGPPASGKLMTSASLLYLVFVIILKLAPSCVASIAVRRSGSTLGTMRGDEVIGNRQQ